MRYYPYSHPLIPERSTMPEIQAFDPLDLWRSRPVGAAIGTPREKIRIEPLEVPVPEKTPAPVEAPAEKEPVG